MHSPCNDCNRIYCKICVVEALRNSNEKKRRAIELQVKNIEYWLETNIPASAEESREIYESLKEAL